MIRIVGSGFGPSMSFNFYMNDLNLGRLSSDNGGNFVVTKKLPDGMSAERVSFAIRDSDSNEITRSLRINPAEQRPQIPDVQNPSSEQRTESIPITILGIADTVRVGDRLKIHGTGSPDRTAVVYVNGPDGSMISSDIVYIDESAVWEVSRSHLIGAHMKVGNYTTVVTDGTQSIHKAWSVTFEKNISIKSDKIKYDYRDTMRFSITTPGNNELIKVQLLNPNNIIIYSDIINPNGTNSILFDYEIRHEDSQGTYTLITSQGDDKEFFFVGVNDLPMTKIRLDLDKVNYGATDIATIDIIAAPSDTLRLNILDRSDNIVYRESIQVQSDGRSMLTLDLEKFENGIYTAEIEKGTEKTSKEFTIGQSGAVTIEVTPVKPLYYLGDQILVSIDTGDRIAPLVIELIDSNGQLVNIKETFSNFIREKDIDKSRALETLQVPSSGSLGKWTINVSSGGTSDSATITIIPRGISIQVSDTEDHDWINTKYIDATVIGAKQTVKVHMETTDGQIIGDVQNISITGANIAMVKWLIPDDIVPGTYILKAEDSHGHTAEVAVKINTGIN